MIIDNHDNEPGGGAQDRTDYYVVHLFYHMKRNNLFEDVKIQVIKVLLFFIFT